jgi:hypothetical protein
MPSTPLKLTSGLKVWAGEAITTAAQNTKTMPASFDSRSLPTLPWFGLRADSKVNHP